MRGKILHFYFFIKIKTFVIKHDFFSFIFAWRYNNYSYKRGGRVAAVCTVAAALSKKHNNLAFYTGGFYVCTKRHCRRCSKQLS